MRLIDADALVDALMMYTWHDEDGWEIHDAEEKREYIKKWLPDIPTVEPKKRESRAKLPCPCGRKRLDMWYGSNGMDYVKCPNCGREASGKTEIAAIRAWNEMVRKEKENARVQI